MKGEVNANAMRYVKCKVRNGKCEMRNVMPPCARPPSSFYPFSSFSPGLRLGSVLPFFFSSVGVLPFSSASFSIDLLHEYLPLLIALQRLYTTGR